MNKEIKQICQKISTNDILEKKFYPVWFFTNERIENFLIKLTEEIKAENIFSIGGGGDFALSCLSVLGDVREVNVCDVRQLAGVTIDLKVAVAKKMSLDEAIEAFHDDKKNNKEEVYGRVRDEITSPSREVFDYIINKCSHQNFLECIKSSGYWYKDSFWQVKNKKYIPYLTEERYSQLREEIDKINIYSGDSDNNLNLFDDDFYDLIYMSNVFDSKNYCQTIESYLLTVKRKIKKEGLLVVVTQDSAKKTIRMMEEFGFELYEKEINRFSIIEAIRGHYCYSFLAFKRE